MSAWRTFSYCCGVTILRVPLGRKKGGFFGTASRHGVSFGLVRSVLRKLSMVPKPDLEGECTCTMRNLAIQVRAPASTAWEHALGQKTGLKFGSHLNGKKTTKIPGFSILRKSNCIIGGLAGLRLLGIIKNRIHVIYESPIA